MKLSISTNAGQLVCRVDVDGHSTILSAADGPSAKVGLLAALDDAQRAGYAECVWPTQAGDYRWVIRRAGARAVVVALWCCGTITGWQHVVYTETDFEPFAAQVRRELERLGDPP